MPRTAATHGACGGTKPATGAENSPPPTKNAARDLRQAGDRGRTSTVASDDGNPKREIIPVKVTENPLPSEDGECSLAQAPRGRSLEGLSEFIRTEKILLVGWRSDPRAKTWMELSRGNIALGQEIPRFAATKRSPPGSLSIL